MTIIIIILVQSYTQTSAKNVINLFTTHCMKTEWYSNQQAVCQNEVYLLLGCDTMWFGEWVPVFWTDMLLPSTWSRIFVFTHQTTHTTSQKQCKETRVYFKNMFFAITSCCMGKESCKEWMTCQKFAVLIHKIVRTLVCIQ